MLRVAALIVVALGLFVAVAARAQIAPQQFIIIFGQTSSARSSPTTCNGTINLSNGCASPMLGGL